MKNPKLRRLRNIFMLVMTLVSLNFSLTVNAQPCSGSGQPAPDAGTLTPKITSNCSGLQLVSLEALQNGDAVVPAGYQTLFLLCSGPNKVVRQINATPAFSVSGNNAYSIHSLVYDPVTFDVATIVLHITKLSDINSTLIQGGGTICAALDLVGAPFTVQRPVAGTITTTSAKSCVDNGTATVAATPDGNANVPYPFLLTYILTSGNGQVIQQINSAPSFSVSVGGLYTIHTLVYDPATLDLTTVVPGVTTAGDVNALLVQGGGNICATLDLTGASTIVEDPFAGGLNPVPAICSVHIEATPNGTAIVPPGYETVYVLTSGAGLVIEQFSATPDFMLTANGQFTMHTLVYDPITLDLNTITLGVTTAFDVNSMLVQGGGSICGSLDMSGAKYNIDAPYSGTLTADAASSCSGLQLVNLSATPDGNTIIATGYQVVYILTSGPNYIIRQMGPTPVFNVSGNNAYRIQTLVYDPATLDLSTIVFHQTSLLTINAQLIQGGGTICASLDMVGAQFTVQRPVAGTLTASNASICFNGSSTNIDAVPDGNANVPYPFSRVYVLTSGPGLVVEQISATPSFSVSSAGLYTIHTLVYDPLTLDLSTIVFGVTTGFDINSMLVQGGGSICASLDVTGAQTVVANPDAGGITANNPVVCLILGFGIVSATPDGDAVVPTGYQTRYLLVNGLVSTIQSISMNPTFIVNATGVYRVLTFIYNPATFNINSIVTGTTNAFNLNGQLIQGGGTVCASLDLLGAVTAVLPFPLCNIISPRYTAEGDFDAQTYELIKTLSESEFNGGAVTLLNTYPNPVSDKLNFEVLSTGNQDLSVIIYNMMGQEVNTTVINTVEGVSTHTIDVSTLESGNYMIRIQSGNDSVSKTFIVRD
ncbi:MAG TPA: T9SS type A sorting domain-containing protein [Bacteroidia bacterium]|nr:T9SS type A sorting domain-containing protein [Bacteroidia bacterium]